MNIVALKKIDVGMVSLEELVGYRGELKMLASNYDDLGIEAPEWIPEKINLVEKEISFQTRAEKQAELKKLKAQESALMSRDERKNLVSEKIKKLEEALSK